MLTQVTAGSWTASAVHREFFNQLHILSRLGPQPSPDNRCLKGSPSSPLLPCSTCNPQGAVHADSGALQHGDANRALHSHQAAALPTTSVQGGHTGGSAAMPLHRVRLGRGVQDADGKRACSIENSRVTPAPLRNFVTDSPPVLQKVRW